MPILILGWIVALVLAAIVRKVLKRTKLDDKIARWISTDDKPPADASRVGGKAVYYLVMLFVLVAFFQQLVLTMVTSPIQRFPDGGARICSAITGCGFDHPGCLGDCQCLEVCHHKDTPGYRS
ncbi:MAG: hypothetical protein R6U51_12770 [Anaerolineales bacterium]